MTEFATTYQTVLSAWVTLGGLILVQAIVADVAGVRGKHTPGMPVTMGHDHFLFRAVRAQANTLENLPVFILLSLAAMLLGATTSWAAGFAWLFVVARVAHMCAYYADARKARGIAFALGFFALIGLLVLSLQALR